MRTNNATDTDCDIAESILMDYPDDVAIVDAFIEAFGGSREDAILRLSRFDKEKADDTRD